MLLKKIIISTLFTTLCTWQLQANDSTLKELIIETVKSFHAIIIKFESTRIAEEDGITAQIVREQTKAIKVILDRLKKAYQSEKEESKMFKEKRELYRKFKVEVYRFWKKTGNMPELDSI